MFLILINEFAVKFIGIQKKRGKYIIELRKIVMATKMITTSTGWSGFFIKNAVTSAISHNNKMKGKKKAIRTIPERQPQKTLSPPPVKHFKLRSATPRRRIVVTT